MEDVGPELGSEPRIVQFRCLTGSLSFRFRLGENFSNECGHVFYYVKIVFLEYLRIPGEIRYSNGPMGSERSKQSGQKPVLGLLCTIIRGREHSDHKSADHEKIALAHEHD